MAPVFLKSPAYVEYVAKYGGENSQYFSEVANYVKKQLSVTMNIPASAWKKYEKQADDLHIAISKNMDKTISTSIK